MDAKILGLCTAAIFVAAAGVIPLSSAVGAPARSEEGVYERYQQYSKAPANDFWYYHPGGPFWLYSGRHYGYAGRHYAYAGRHSRHHASWHARWHHQYAWRGHYRWAAHPGFGRWGGPPIDGQCWSGEPSLRGWREIWIC
ncbi:MAG: hypothetical protein JOY76_02045 [Hyphomicrobiales bacterium]|nr:hypothetical protein [Hyphomicrobiales bacterium]